MGFIGSHIVERLVLDGHEVVVLDNKSAPENSKFYEFKGAKYYEVDICDISTHSLYKDVDCVFHLAARSRIQPTIGSPDECFKVNTIGTQSVLEACRKNDVEKVIYSTSSSCYGLKNKTPFKETADPDCLNPYSLSKYFGEKLCDLYSSLYGLNCVSLRYFNVYGPREPVKGEYAPVIGLFKRQKALNMPCTVVGDGNQRRDFTYISDVVRANISSMDNSSIVGHEIFNIGMGKNYSILDIVDLIGGEKDFIETRKAEIRETLADVTKASEMLGWKPIYSLESMILSY